jgi:hypothetical protein
MKSSSSAQHVYQIVIEDGEASTVLEAEALSLAEVLSQLQERIPVEQPFTVSEDGKTLATMTRCKDDAWQVHGVAGKAEDQA